MTVQQTLSVQQSANIAGGLQADRLQINGDAGIQGGLSVVSSLGLGSPGVANGSVFFNNATNANTVTLQSGVTSTSYAITLPSAIGTAGQCLTVAGVVGTTQTLGYGSCGGGGGGGTQTVTLVPEFAGAVFTADGSSNTGYMTSDRVSGLGSGEGYKHNFYAWSTDQSAAQDYDIVTEYQLPSNFTSFAAGSLTAWDYRNDNTNDSISYTIYDANGDSCSSGTLAFAALAGTWNKSAMTTPSTTSPCSFAANDIITIDFKLTAISPATNYVKLGEVQFSYN
jgi:hypothetical protein